MKIIAEAVVLYEGWEMDNEAWITEDSNGKRSLRTTSHGSECEMTTQELDEKIHETRESLRQLKHLRDLISNKP